MDWLDPEPKVLWTLGGALASLALGSGFRLLAARAAGRSDATTDRLRSLRTWWLLMGLLAAAIVVGRAGVAVLFAAASLLGLREYLRMVPDAAADRVLAGVALAAVPVQYLWVLLGWFEALLAFLPLLVFLLLPALRIVQGRTEGFHRTVPALSWGLLLTVYGLSHTAYLAALPEPTNPVAGPAGWLLYVVLLTETNDICQSLVGRRIGRRRFTPRVSPNKTVAGLVGGSACTVALAVGLAPVLTPLLLEHEVVPGLAVAAGYGLVVALVGLLGDLVMSAVKRSVGVKDSGTTLPGQGGVLDRVDSLIVSGPVMLWLIRGLHG